MAKLNETKLNELKGAESIPPKVDTSPKVEAPPKDKINRQVKCVRATKYTMQTPQGVSVGKTPVELPITPWIQAQLNSGFMEVVETTD